MLAQDQARVGTGSVRQGRGGGRSFNHRVSGGTHASGPGSQSRAGPRIPYEVLDLVTRR